MNHRSRYGTILWVLPAVLVFSVMRCQCAPHFECTRSVDCAGRTWNGDGCTEGEGFWTCRDGTCIAVCSIACESTDDCVSQPWPQHADCTEANGRWECINGYCRPVCARECLTAADCATAQWPADAGCVEEEGEWACWDGACFAVCGP